jgi:hypothetical protein
MTVELNQRICPSCKYSGPDLVRVWSCATNKMLCNYCVNQDAVGSDAMNMIDKLAKHQAEGTLSNYSAEERMTDIRGSETRKKDEHLN